MKMVTAMPVSANAQLIMSTAGPWLMRFSVVRFSLVRSLKKIQKNLAYADFHQSPSLVRKISMIQIKISICQITILVVNLSGES